MDMIVVVSSWFEVINAHFEFPAQVITHRGRASIVLGCFGVAGLDKAWRQGTIIRRCLTGSIVRRVIEKERETNIEQERDRWFHGSCSADTRTISTGCAFSLDEQE